MKSKTAAPALTTQEVLAQLKELADPQTKKTMLRHGAVEPIWGVKIGEMKKIQKKTKTNHALALELFDTGIYDAAYLAGMIADAQAVTQEELQHWVETAPSQRISSWIVTGLAAESPHGLAMALRWIESPIEFIASVGWGTLAGIAGYLPDDQIPLDRFRKLIARVEKEIHKAPDDVRYKMNSFLIAVGGGIVPLSEAALAAAQRIGTVECDMGDTACQVPDARAYIEKIKSQGRLGHKRAHVRC